MKEVIFEIIENIQVSSDVYKMVLKGDTSEIKRSGEFVEVQLDNKFLRRPFSVCDYDCETLTLLYKILGHGTKDMTKYEIGKKLNVLVGLGNGFDHTVSQKPLLVGGGIGVAPLYNLAKKFNDLGIKPTIILGYRNKDDVYFVEEFQKVGNVIVTTDDGSYGYHGNACTYLKNEIVDFDKYYSCGPLIMLKNLALTNPNGYVSLEARMGCGFGACMGCSIETTNGVKRVCKEGPVFMASEVKF